MKSKWYVITILGITAIFCATLFGLFEQNRAASTSKDLTYTSIVLNDQSFYAYFPKKYFKKDFTLLNANGRKVEPSYEWQEHNILEIDALEPGTYSLKVYKKNSKKTEKVSFEVKNMPEQVQNEQQLKDYFRSIKELYAVMSAPSVVNNGGIIKNILREFEAVEESAQDSAGSNNANTTADYSNTNNQVEDIEEGDIAVTNGEYLFLARDGDVVIVKPQPLEQVGKITIPENMIIDKLFVKHDLLIIQYIDYLDSTPKTTVKLYNVKTPENPALVHTFAQEGYTLDSRIYDHHLYLLSSYYVIEEDEVIPSVSINNKDNLIETKDIYIHPISMSEEYTVISKLDLTSFDTKTKAFLGAGGSLYMSENAIYMAAIQWQPIPFMSTIEPNTTIRADRAIPIINDTGETTIIKYTFQNDIEKVAETKIKGHLLNQFSMDEYNGYFRVAATVGNANLNNPERNSENLLYIFDQNLKEVGKLENLARGERIYSVRFMGEKAYMVTFVETDPLFVLDLQDPSKPMVKGELKIPGYSNYLHPIGENHLLGIGHDTKVRNDGKNKFVETHGVKLSLFNVTDPSNPIEQDVEIIGGAGTSSSVNYSHKGLYRDVANNRYGFDITIYNDQYYEGTGAAFYEITPNGIDNPKLFIEKAAGEQYEDWNQTVKRILYVGDRTFIIKNSQIKSIDRATLNEIKTIELK